jgi:transcriptional regulator with XRE-family HTH domain
MNTHNQLVTQQEQEDIVDMFADLPAQDPFDIKKEQIAIALTSLIAFAGKTRTNIASELGLHKSAVTRLLSGKNNTKLKTIWDVASYLGYDFDVIFHSKNEPAPKQPWQIQFEREHATYVTRTVIQNVEQQRINIQIQTPQEALRDIDNGVAASAYVSAVQDALFHSTLQSTCHFSLPDTSSEDTGLAREIDMRVPGPTNTPVFITNTALIPLTR